MEEGRLLQDVREADGEEEVAGAVLLLLHLHLLRRMDHQLRHLILTPVCIQQEMSLLLPHQRGDVGAEGEEDVEVEDAVHLQLPRELKA